MDRFELTCEALMPRKARIRLAGIATADTNPTGDRVARSPVVVGASFGAFDRGQLRTDRGGQALQHPARGDGLAGQAHRLIQRVVEAFGAQRGDEQAEVGGGFDAVGQFQFQVAELVGDAFQGAAPGLGAAVGGLEAAELAHVGVGGLADRPQLCRGGDGLDGGDEDGVLDEVRVAADHAHVRADGGQPPGAAVELGGVADRAVFVAVGQVGAVDQPLDQVFAVVPSGAGDASNTSSWRSGRKS